MFIFCDVYFSQAEPFAGTVIDKHYRAESTSTGVGTVYNPQGGAGLVTTTSHDPEAFLLMVKTASGQVVTAECESSLYYSKQVGNTVQCYNYTGKFTGGTWYIQASK
jgi:hypothetical protein